MMKKQKNGKRKPKENWQITVAIGCYREEADRWRAAAKADGRSLSQWVRWRLERLDAIEKERALTAA